jgi:hypothetical protein
MNWSLIPTSLSAAERAGGGADRHPGQRHHEDEADQQTPEAAGRRARGGRVKQLIELDRAVGLLDRDHGVGQLDQILLLHVQKLLPDFLGLCFGREGDCDKISHPCSLPVAAVRRR